MYGAHVSWIKHGTDPQEAAAVAGKLPEGDWGYDPLEGVFTNANGIASAVANERGDYRLFWTALVKALRGGLRESFSSSSSSL